MAHLLANLTVLGFYPRSSAFICGYLTVFNV
jgi:hypothetical protein